MDGLHKQSRFHWHIPTIIHQQYSDYKQGQMVQIRPHVIFPIAADFGMTKRHIALMDLNTLNLLDYFFFFYNLNIECL